MENIGLGLYLMLIGMVTVFVILLIVIFGSRALISIVNRIVPPEAARTTPQGGNEKARAIIEEAVRQLTSGKGKVTEITKL